MASVRKFILLIFFVFTACDNANDYIITKRKILRVKNDSLFIITENWGLAGDQQKTFITTKEANYDSTNTIIWDGLEPFVYKMDNDSLFVFTKHIVSIPNRFSSLISIVQIEITDSELVQMTIDINRRKNAFLMKP